MLLYLKSFIRLAQLHKARNVLRGVDQVECPSHDEDMQLDTFDIYAHVGIPTTGCGLALGRRRLRRIQEEVGVVIFALSIFVTGI